jgi:preprotein translocase subunit SecA
MEHLEAMEYMRSSVRLRAYGQRDPLIVYKNEAIRLFRGLESSIKANFSHLILHHATQAPIVKTRSNPPSRKATEDTQFGKLGRNDPCYCGATHPDGRPKKYKHCHGKNA